MPVTHYREELGKEHEQLSHLAARIEKMLELASKNDYAEHLKSIRGLQSLELDLSGVVRHCHMEDEAIESAYRHSLQHDERMRIATEHEQLIHAVKNFVEELQFATVDRTMAMIVPGMDLVNRLRAHVAYERELLGRLRADGSSASTAGKKTRVNATRKHRRHVPKPQLGTKAESYLPYTVESHPEL